MVFCGLVSRGEKCSHQLLGIDVPPPRGPIIFLGAAFFRRYSNTKPTEQSQTAPKWWKEAV
eukprot:3484981-Amphidinium_carterae.1